MLKKVTTETLRLLPAALVILSAAVFGFAQQASETKHNSRPEVTAPAPTPDKARDSEKSSARYSYEFTQPNFYIRHIVLNHDAQGRGQITFEKLNDETPITEPLLLSEAAWPRISAL